MSDDLIKALQKEAREDAEIITRLRAELAAVTAERDYVMAEGLFSADQIRILKTDLAAVTEERDRMRAALEPFAKLKPVAWSLENDHYFIATDDICRARAAADAIEALLAERDDFAEQLALRSESGMAKDLQEIMRINNELVAERDALAARLAPVEDEALVAERDQLKGVIQSYQILLETQQGMFVAVQAERDALAARLAPVEDEALLKMVDEIIYVRSVMIGTSTDEIAREVITHMRPHIEAAERERCAKELTEACELLHKLTAIIPGNDGAGEEVAEFLRAASNRR